MLILLYGQDGFRQRRKLNELKAKFRTDVDPEGMNSVELDADKLTLAKLNEVAGAVSMFASKRFIAIHGIFKIKDEKHFAPIAEYITKQAAGEHIFVLLHESVASAYSKAEKLPKYKQAFYEYCTSQPFSQEFGRLSQADLINWIKKEVSDRGGQITGDAVTAMLGLTTGDLWQISQEIDKLVHLKQASQDGASVFRIEAADVKMVVRGVFEEHIFALTDAIGERNRARAVKLLEEELSAGQEPEQILFMIVRQFKLLLQVRDALEQGLPERTIGDAMKLHSYVLKKLVSQSRHYSAAVLKNILGQLIKLDYQNKTGQVDLVAGLEVVVSKI